MALSARIEGLQGQLRLVADQPARTSQVLSAQLQLISECADLAEKSQEQMAIAATVQQQLNLWVETFAKMKPAAGGLTPVPWRLPLNREVSVTKASHAIVSSRIPWAGREPALFFCRRG